MSIMPWCNEGNIGVSSDEQAVQLVQSVIDLRDMVGPNMARIILLQHVLDLTQCVETISNSQKSGDTTSLRRALHRAAGLCGQYSKNELSDYLGRLSDRPENEMKNSIPSLIRKLEALAVLTSAVIEECA